MVPSARLHLLPAARYGLAAGLMLVVLAAVAAAEAPTDRNDQFTAYIGTNAFQFSPLHPGGLSQVRLFTVLSHPDAARDRDFGRTFWRLRITGPGASEQMVRYARGAVWLDDQGAAYAEFYWDGRDTEGNLVPAGEYRYTFQARFVSNRLKLAQRPAIARMTAGYDDIEAEPDIEEAFASTGRVVVNYGLDEEGAAYNRESRVGGACALQQNTPLASGFGYNFYYGSTHSHSNYSDGGQDPGNCVSGNANGSGAFGPDQVYDYARNAAGMDYWIITDHNHLFEEAVTTGNPPLTEAKVRQRYAYGLAAASSATVDGAFVALWGQEFGVLTNSDQGHVIVIESPKLFGWDSCSSCTGSTPECSAGSNCYFDIYVPKRYAYLTLYARSVQYPSAAGALGILCHPDSGHFDGFAYNADADAAMQGIAVRSGLAFSTSVYCDDANVGSSNYFARWMTALNKGFHVAPTAEQDSHCNNHGVAVPTRTVYLIPNSLAPALTRANLMNAHKARHFFATEDPNLQLVFGTADNSRIMGDIFTAGTSVDLRVAALDPDGESTYAIEIWRGQIGGGVLTSAYKSYSNQSAVTLTDAPGTGTWYYFVHVTQADGHDAYSAPMWITFGGTPPPTYSIAGNAGAAGAAVTAGGVSATADASGNYTLAGLAAGTYTVTPSKSGCTFTPATLSVTVGPSATGKNFTAACGGGDTALTSGVTLSGQSVAKGAWKYYFITVPAGATQLVLKTTGASADVDIYSKYNAKPTSSSYDCRPYSSSGNETCTHANPSAGTWWLGVYGYAAGTFAVTGTVTAGGTTYSIAGSAGTAGATVTAGGATAVSDASGNYTLAGLAAGTYTVTPSKSGCTFTPAALSVTVGPNATGKNFTAACGGGDTALASGVTLSGQSVAQGAWKYYFITVPAGASALEFKTTGASGDVDIYSKYSAKPTSSSYDCRPYTSSGNETCTHASPSAGTWWLGVYGYAAASFAVTATVAGGTAETELLANVGFESITASTNSAPDGSWVRSAYTGSSFNVLVANGAYPHAGSDHAYLGVSNSSSQTLDSKAVTIPAGATAATLSFWLSVVTSETGSTAYDKLLVQLVNGSGAVVATLATLSNLDKTASAGTYALKSYNAIAYKGQTVKVRFKATNGSSYATTFRVDDVSLKSR
ncbi:MAG TPA: pre-peptidase C-terminal domain-containing protein [Acidobacteriota bacterium]|nr:pre-peptidase C-terminal domain-containing protein [Acidobacteriota bacterium]HQM63908.1 pre-peptidase C-terminal domain-containing protein [Acidobacteriota bacterium]